MNLKIAILYNSNNLKVKNVFEHLSSFSKYSDHQIYYIDAIRSDIREDLNLFDCVVCHYSLYLFFRSAISLDIQKRIHNFQGLKVYIAQDEQDNVNIARKHYLFLGFQLVFTCGVSSNLRKILYPDSLFKEVEFIDILTGYVDCNSIIDSVPLKERRFDIVYRGSDYWYYYGSLGLEKVEIGEKMKEYAISNGLKHDIEWVSNKKILDKAWFDFLSSGRSTLITESGSSIIYFDDKIKNNIKNCEKKYKNLSFEEFNTKFQLCDKKHEIKCISPKVFEAIKLKTALICYEGEYSGVIKPNMHYIPLKKNWNNISEVISKIRDLKHLEEITTRCYNDIIESNKYSYSEFISFFDKTIVRKFKTLKKKTLNIGQKHYSNIATEPQKYKSLFIRKKTIKEVCILNYYYEGNIYLFFKFCIKKLITKTYKIFVRT